MSRAAAFFDLDKTLMAGSSGMQFARVAARHKLVSRRQLASWGFEHLRYRLRGTTDERTTEVLRVARELIAGVPARSFERMNPEVMAAILPRVYPQMLDEVYAHQDAGRPTFIVSAAGSGVVEPLANGARHGRRGRHPLRSRRGRRPHRPLRRALRLRRGQGRGDAGLRRRARHRPRRLLRLLRLDLRPADAARRRQPGRRSTPTRRWPRSPATRAGRRCASSASAAAWSRSRSPCWRPSPASAARASPPAASSRPAVSPR